MFVHYVNTNYTPCPEKRLHGILDISLANLNIFSYFLAGVSAKIHVIKISKKFLLILQYHYVVLTDVIMTSSKMSFYSIRGEKANTVADNNFNKIKRTFVIGNIKNVICN